jgi:hypothetical protein
MRKLRCILRFLKKKCLKEIYNEDRTKTVPDHILESMFKSYVRPTIEEGFASVNDGHFFSCPLS